MTARHVVEDKTIVEVKPTAPMVVPISQAIPMSEAVRATYLEVLGEEPGWPTFSEPLTVVDGPVYHHNPRVDVAAFRTAPLTRELPYIPLGTHLDDWVRDDQFVLSEAIPLRVPADTSDNEPDPGCGPSRS